MAKKVETTEINNDPSALVIPTYGGPGWHDYVMSLFDPDTEMVDGHPNVAGLRRVARLALGEIIFSCPMGVNGPTTVDGPGRATVTYQIVILRPNGTEWRFGDVADVYTGNTDDLFALHPAATASTRAESRCLRKVLLIRACAAEELTKKDIVAEYNTQAKLKVGPATQGEVDPKAGISENQYKCIQAICRKINLDPEKAVMFYAKKAITDLNKSEASETIAKLDAHQRSESPISPELMAAASK